MVFKENENRSNESSVEDDWDPDDNSDYQPSDISESDDSIVLEESAENIQIKVVNNVSRRESRINQMIKQFHIKRLDNLLSSNEMKRIAIYPDGNCFFEAFLKTCDEADEFKIDLFRNDVCDHISSNKKKYLGFRTGLEKRQMIELVKDIHNLRQSGIWNNDIADCIPLAVANMFKCRIQIFSSSTLSPVYEVCPSLNESATKEMPLIPLAYLAVPGEEHYSKVGELYYSRKLCVYNLSVYSLGGGQGVCHLWDETQGKRGANEIATCLFRNTASICQSNRMVDTIRYYCDTCGGQNRNRIVASSLLLSLSDNPQLQTINQKFLESGHSQMECDSVHSAIEKAKTRTEVFVPSQWSTVITYARKVRPYIVMPMKYGDVLNFKDFVKSCINNIKVGTSKEKINWLKIKWIQVRRDSPRSLFIAYNFDPKLLIEIKVQPGTRAKNIGTYELKQCYTEKLQISSEKKKDLLKLCEKQIVPSEYHDYFSKLPTGEFSDSNDEESDIDN